MCNGEYLIKAAYLDKFDRYVTWPDGAFADPQSPFVIGVLEAERVSSHLRALAQTKQIDGRPVDIREFDCPAQITPCQILFLPKEVDREVRQEVIRRLSGKHVLFVGETDGFLSEGGVFEFVLRQNNVRIAVNLIAARRENLTISSKLLAIAVSPTMSAN